MTLSFTMVSLFVFFLIVYLLSIRERSYIQIRALLLFRAVFPAWRFFEDVTTIPHLEARFKSNSDEFSPWISLLHKPKRKVTNIIFNPETNLFHAYQSLLQQVESDISELNRERTDDFTASVSFRLLLALVRQELKLLLKNGPPGAEAVFQFRLRRVRQGSTILECIDEETVFLTSQVYQA